MAISCVVVDDEQHSVDVLTDYIQSTSFLDLVLATTNPVEGLQFVQQQAVDLVFLDVNMPQLSGIQFLKLLQGNCKAILTTAYTEYALEGYEYSVVDYLLKPISFERFLKAAQKLLPAAEKPGGRPELLEEVKSILNDTRQMNETLLSQFQTSSDFSNTPTASKPHWMNHVSLFHLTHREIEIIQLIAQGKPNAEIANMLSISDNTAITHVRNIFRKVGVSSRSKLINKLLIPHSK